MPTYDYECDACGHRFELFQSISENPKRKCPECKKSKLRRLFGTGAALMFKGSGFYQTDYRSESYKKASEADKKPAGDDSSGSSKPAAEGKKSESNSAASGRKSDGGAAARGKGKNND